MRADPTYFAGIRRRRFKAAVGAGLIAVLSTAAMAAAAPSHTPQPIGAGATPLAAATTPYSSVTVSQHIVRSGQQVTISGNGPKNSHAGVWITLQSDALVSKTTVDGIPSVRAQELVNGEYSVTATIRSGLQATNYAIAGSFDGQPLDTVAWVQVVASVAHPYSSVTVSPSSVRSGQRVTVSGNGPKNAHAGSWITLQSDAFASKTSVDGIPSLRTQELVNGKYSVTAPIRSGLKPTTYGVAGSFNGKPLDTAAWVTVR